MNTTLRRGVLLLTVGALALSGCLAMRAAGTPSSGPLIGSPKSTQDLTPVFAKAETADFQRVIDSAKPTIGEFLKILVCVPAGEFSPSKYTQRFLDPGAYSNDLINPKVGMKYNQSQCVKVIMIGGWKPASKNAFSFMTAYESPDSGEGFRARYTAVRQPDGNWLFRPELF